LRKDVSNYESHAAVDSLLHWVIVMSLVHFCMLKGGGQLACKQAWQLGKTGQDLRRRFSRLHPAKDVLYVLHDTSSTQHAPLAV